MAKKQPAHSATKGKSTKQLKDSLEGRLREKQAATELEQRNATHILRIEELERELREARKAQLRFPDDMYEMNHFLRSAPSGWHLHTLVEMITRHLLRLTKMESPERQKEAWDVLSRIARKFRVSGKTSKKYAPDWLIKAVEEPSFQSVWNEPLPKRTKGDMKGNATGNVISLFVEGVMLAYDKSIEYDSFAFGEDCPSRRERYGKPDEYINGFIPFAKQRWESGGREGVEALLDHFTPEVVKLNPEILQPDKLQRRLHKLHPADRLYLVLHVWGGLSRSEIFGLRWEHVDFKKRLIRVPSHGSWKNGLQCVATITPQMEKWLTPCARRKGGVVTIYGKLRPNVSNDECTPKRSFGLFKDEIEEQAREFLASWRGAYPP